MAKIAQKRQKPRENRVKKKKLRSCEKLAQVALPLLPSFSISA